MSVETIIATSASPIFVTDERWRIVTLNKAAEELLGRRSAEIQGQTCHQLVCGRDVYGNRFCHESCIVGSMASRGEPIRYFEMEIETAQGTSLRCGFLVLVLPGPAPGQLRILHIMTPCGNEDQVPANYLSRPETAEIDPSPISTSPRRDYKLTAREAEVLRLLVQGHKAKDIAAAIGTSLSTVRNHMQNLLRKLEVHSQLEAVALARNERLV